MDLIGAVQELSIWDVLIVIAFAYFVYKFVILPRYQRRHEPKPEPELPPFPMQDMTVQQLLPYDGAHEEVDNRLLLACNGTVFDVTRGKRNYGPGGPYCALAGRDASRALAKMQLDASAVSDEYDELADLDSSELDSMKEWAESFSLRYPTVGKLLKPGEKPGDYDGKLAKLSWEK